MSEHITDIEQELRNSEIELFNAATEYRQLVTYAADKRAKYDLEWAKELLKITTTMKDAKLTVAEKEAMTLKAVESHFIPCRIAEAEAEASKRQLSAIQAIQSSIQTRSRLLQTELSLLNTK